MYYIVFYGPLTMEHPMITCAESVSDETDSDRQLAQRSPRDREASYASILRTLQIFPLGQEEDSRGLTESVILGEN